MCVPLTDKVQARSKLPVDRPLLMTECRNKRESASPVVGSWFGSANNDYEIRLDGCQKHAAGFGSRAARLAKAFDSREGLWLYAKNLVPAPRAQFDAAS